MNCLYFFPFRQLLYFPLINSYNNQLFETIPQLFTYISLWSTFLISLETHTNLPFSVPVLLEEVLAFMIFVAVVFIPSVPETWALALSGPHVIRTAAKTAYSCLEQSRLTFAPYNYFFFLFFFFSFEDKK